MEILTTINRTYSSVTQHVDTAGTMLPFASTWTQSRFLWGSFSMIRSLFTYITFGYNYTTIRTRQIRVILLFCDDSDTRQPNKTREIRHHSRKCYCIYKVKVLHLFIIFNVFSINTQAPPKKLLTNIKLHLVQSLVFCVVCCRLLFVLFLLAIVLSVLIQFTLLIT